ncbi:MAG: iron ABC transporter permease, partial [Lentisphaerae bacterium]|nr:iron ABC transporter permease [Lentisphaerota bacterium]
MKNLGSYVTGLATLAFFAVFFLWPLARILAGGFVHDGGFTLGFLAEVFRNPVTVEGLRNSFALAVATTALVMAITMPLVLLAARYDFPGKTLLTGLVLAPMVLPPFVGAIGLRQFLGQYGVFNALLVKANLMTWAEPVDWLAAGRFWAVAVTEALHLYPIFYLNALAAVSNVDPGMEEAASNLGASGWHKFRRVTLPLILPGLFAGGTIVFIWSFTELGTPLMFDYLRVTPVQVYDGLKDIGASPFPYALVTVMLAASVMLYALSKWLFGRGSHAMLGKGAQAAAIRRLSGFRGVALAASFLALFLLAALPHIGVILTSVGGGWYRTVLPVNWTLSHYTDALGHGLTLGSIRNSLLFSSVAMAVDLALGVAIAYVVVRGTLRWRGLLDALAMLPLAVPGIVLAFGYVAMSQPGRLFEFLNPATNPTGLLIVAYAIRRLPYVVRSVSAGLQQTSAALEEAAQSVGCPPWRA